MIFMSSAGAVYIGRYLLAFCAGQPERKPEEVTELRSGYDSAARYGVE